MPPKKKTDSAAKPESQAKPDAPRKLNSEEIASLCAQVADDRKAMNIVRLKMAGVSDVTDYVVLCTGTSEPHLGAISERVQRELRNSYQLRPVHVDGKPSSHWMIVDYGCVMMHVMTEETRELYQLESLWGDAPRVEAVKKITGAAKKLRKESAAAQEA